MTRTVEIEAPAKVNLVLDVLGRRPDGFHDLDTLFQAVSLADVVRLTLGDDDGRNARVEGAPDPARGGHGTSGGPRPGDAAPGSAPWVRSAGPPIQLFIDGPDLGPLESNLAYRAARRFLEVTGGRAPVRIELKKRIPMGAGLGGGSSDAAAVLKALAFLAGFQDDGVLHEVAAELGSDVPFFLGDSPLARGRGRGEILTPLPALGRAHLVLALPEVHVSTAEAYAALAATRPGTETDEARRGATPGDGGEGGGAGREAAREAPSSWAEVEEISRNDFEPVVVPRHEEIRRSLQALRDAGATVALLSGSGAACFGLFGGRARAKEVAERLSGAHPWPFLSVTTRTTLPEPVALE